MKVRLVQPPLPSIESISNLLRDRGPCDLICLPEQFDTGYSIEPVVSHEGLAFMRRLGTAVVGTITEAGAQNVAYVVDPQVRYRYVKLHRFTRAGEDKYYQAGDALPPLLPLHGFCMAVAICYDVRFPELFRVLTERGATLFVVPANWPSKRLHHWQILLRARAIENQAYVIGVNRSGEQYAGHSMVIAPDGNVLAEAGDDAAVLDVDIDIKQVELTRRHLGFLQDVRRDVLPLGGP